MDKILEKKVLFDGGENPAKWKAHEIPEGIVPNEFVERCDAGAVNLHIYSKGWYKECWDCPKRLDCRDYGVVVGEQAEP